MLIFRQEFLPKSQGQIFFIMLQLDSVMDLVGEKICDNCCENISADHTNDMIANFAAKLCNKGFAVFTMDAEVNNNIIFPSI
jgi:hypothetical protein